MMTRKTFTEALVRIGACGEALEYVKATKGTPPQLWAKCKRQDWLLWLAGHAGLTDAKPIVRAAIDIARSVLVHVPAGEARPEAAIAAAEACAEDPSEANRAAAQEASTAAYTAASDAADAASYAASDAASDVASYAASTAAYTAASDVAGAARSASGAASEAARSASCAAYTAASNAASNAAFFAQQAKNRRLIRKHITWGMVERALTKKKSNSKKKSKR
jgi:hypothetical protein